MFPRVRDCRAFAIDDGNLAVLAIGIVCKKLSQYLRRSASLREQADREIVVAWIGGPLRESCAGIRAQRTVTIEADRKGIASNPDAVLPAARAACDYAVGHIMISGNRRLNSSVTQSVTAPARCCPPRLSPAWPTRP